MEVGPQETDFDILVRDVEATGVPMPLSSNAQTNRLHLAGLGVFRAVPVRPQLSVVDEPEPAVWRHIYTNNRPYEFPARRRVARCSTSQAVLHI